MNTISQIDKNLKVETSINEENIVFHDVRNTPFQIYGLYKPKNPAPFRRIPESIAKATSEGVYGLHTNTSGGRVRFKTNSKFIAIHVTMPNVTCLSHMPVLGVSGFDMYLNHNGKSRYCKSFVPPFHLTDGYESIHYFNTIEDRDITIHFPLYNDVSEVYIGIKDDATLHSGDRYMIEKPIVFYGSSITQGGCASRPGNSYPAILSRMLDFDFINLGFSGNGKAEDIIVDYISGLDMSVFVSDYDHNAPCVEYLEATHGKMIQKIRANQPQLPIILISKPDFDNDIEENTKRRNVIYQTYLNAFSNGDKNIYYIDGSRMFGNLGRDSCTVDGTHPNDLGFMRMAEALHDTLASILYI